MILVTGGTGLLGSHLLLELVKEHEEVVATKRASSKLEEVKQIFNYYSNEADELFELIDWVDADMLDYGALLSAMEGIDQVYNCAAMVSFEWKFRKKMIRNNVEGTANLVNACIEKGIEKLVHVSSSSAIGKSADGLPSDETMIFSRTKSSTGYSLSKFKSEMEVWRGIENGLKAVIVNPTIILGPGYWQQGSSAMFSRIRKRVRFYTTGETGFVGVKDVVNAMIRLMNSEILNERFIINAENIAYRDVFSMISNAFGKKPPERAVSYSLLRFLSRLDWVIGLLTGSRRITSEQARSGFSKNHFSNKKICEATGIEFIPIREVIDSITNIYEKK